MPCRAEKARISLPWLLLGAIAVTFGCTDTTVPDLPGPATKIEIVTAAPAEAKAGEPFAQAPVIRVVDAKGRVVATPTVVTLSITTGEGALGGTVEQTTADGIATFDPVWISGTVGPLTLTVSAPGLESAKMDVVLVPGPAAALNFVGPTSFTDTVAAVLVPQVRVVDASGNGVAGIVVQFSASGQYTSNSGVIEGPVDTTDASGFASPTSWTLPSAAQNTYFFRATWSGGQNTITVTTVLGGPARVDAAYGGIGTPGGATNIRVIVHDRASNQLSGVKVDLVVVEGGGTVSPSSVYSAIRGYSEKSSTWSFGSSMDTQIVEARVDGVTRDTLRAVMVPPFKSKSILVSQDICTLGESGKLWCWGPAIPGGPAEERHPRELATNVQLAALGTGGDSWHKCALTAAGAAYCWGRNDHGELGNGEKSTYELTPIAVDGGIEFRQISSGVISTCGLSVDSTAYCWGNNIRMQLGDSTLTDRIVPAPVKGTTRFSAIASGYFFGCGLATDSTAYCWGLRPAAGAGTFPCEVSGGSFCTPVPTPISTSLRFESISAGSDHACGLTASGATYCWGHRETVQAGTLAPVLVDSPVAFASIFSGGNNTCALTAAGEAYCWGGNRWGELGTEAVTATATPVKVATSTKFSTLSLGPTRTCGIASDDVVFCWGRDPLGTGISGAIPRPVFRP